MPSKAQKEKVKPVVWSSGRGGAGNISKSRTVQKRVPIDPDIRPQVKILEIETARNRSTAGGRGGRGNRYDHVLEPGLFQRVMQHETAQIVVAKAETEANRSTKTTTSRVRSRSTVSREDTNDSLHSSRPSTRLRSASTSTFGTSISGSSASPSNVSSSTQSQYTRSATPASNSVASRLFSPVSWKKRVFGGGSVDSTDTNSIWSTDNTSLRSVTPIIGAPNPIAIAIPERYGERSSSMYALPTPVASESFSNSKASRSIVPSTSFGSYSSTSLDFIPHTHNSSCSPPRYGPRPAPSAPISAPNLTSVPVRPPRPDRPRGFALANGDRLAIFDRDFTSAPLSQSFTRSNADVSVTASPSASPSRGDGLDGYPFLVEGRIPDCQEPPFTAYHLPLRPNIVRHNFPIPMSRTRKGSELGV